MTKRRKWLQSIMIGLVLFGSGYRAEAALPESCDFTDTGSGTYSEVQSIVWNATGGTKTSVTWQDNLDTTTTGYLYSMYRSEHPDDAGDQLAGASSLLTVKASNDVGVSNVDQIENALFLNNTDGQGTYYEMIWGRNEVSGSGDFDHIPHGVGFRLQFTDLSQDIANPEEVVVQYRDPATQDWHTVDGTVAGTTVTTSGTATVAAIATTGYDWDGNGTAGDEGLSSTLTGAQATGENGSAVFETVNAFDGIRILHTNASSGAFLRDMQYCLAPQNAAEPVITKKAQTYFTNFREGYPVTYTIHVQNPNSREMIVDIKDLPIENLTNLSNSNGGATLETQSGTPGVNFQNSSQGSINVNPASFTDLANNQTIGLRIPANQETLFYVDTSILSGDDLQGTCAVDAVTKNAAEITQYTMPQGAFDANTAFTGGPIADATGTIEHAVGCQKLPTINKYVVEKVVEPGGIVHYGIQVRDIFLADASVDDYLTIEDVLPAGINNLVIEEIHTGAGYGHLVGHRDWGSDSNINCLDPEGQQPVITSVNGGTNNKFSIRAKKIAEGRSCDVRIYFKGTVDGQGATLADEDVLTNTAHVYNSTDAQTQLLASASIATVYDAEGQPMTLTKEALDPDTKQPLESVEAGRATLYRYTITHQSTHNVDGVANTNDQYNLYDFYNGGVDGTDASNIASQQPVTPGFDAARPYLKEIITSSKNITDQSSGLVSETDYQASQWRAHNNNLPTTDRAYIFQGVNKLGHGATHVVEDEIVYNPDYIAAGDDLVNKACLAPILFYTLPVSWYEDMLCATATVEAETLKIPLIKTADDVIVDAGQTVNYTLTAYNDSDTDLSLCVSDVIDERLIGSLQSVAAAPIVHSSSDGSTHADWQTTKNSTKDLYEHRYCGINIPAGANQALTYKVTVPADAVPLDIFDNVAEVYLQPGSSTLTALGVDPYGAAENIAIMTAEESQTALDNNDNHKWRLHIPGTDFGDAPASYGDVQHTVQPGDDIYLGTTAPDHENTQSGNDTATADDSAEHPEDGVATVPTLTVQKEEYTVPVVCAGEGAVVSAWIDLNGNGTFDDDERNTNHAVACTSGTAVLTWTSITGQKAGQSYMRVRIASNATELATATTSASDGEVEDYAITIHAVPPAEDDAREGDIGEPVTVDILSNDGDADTTLLPETVQIAGTTAAGESFTVESEGVWSVDTTTGEITFTPESGFTSSPTPITYTVKDAHGNMITAKVVVTYPVPVEEKDDKPEDHACRGSIGNHIWLDLNWDGEEQTEVEPGIADVDIKLRWAGEDNKWGTRDDEKYEQETGDKTGRFQGRYLFEDLPEGRYRVIVDEDDVKDYAQTYDPTGSLINNRATVILGCDEDRRDLDFGFAPREERLAQTGAWAIAD